MQASIEIRELAGHDEYQACVALERETWGAAFAECVPPAILMVSQKIGGVTAGAFDKSGRLMGFVYGLTGIQDGRLVHWSHMLAVRPEVRDSGLGTRLKRYQRDRVKSLGVDTMYWTYDPLVAKNAHINLNHLGTAIERYVVDMYIDGNESDLHRGLGMDRFIVKWPLAAAGARRPDPAAITRAFRDAPVVNTGTDPAGNPVLRDPVQTDSAVLVEIPEDIQAIQADAMAAAAWRENTRAALTGYLNRGHVVAGFRRDPDTRRCFYLLTESGKT